MRQKKRSGLRVCTTVVRADLKSNDDRIAAAKGLISSRPNDSELVVLPAGFLKARSEGEVREVAAPVIDAARAAKVAVIIGVDAAGKGSAKKGSLPYFLVGWSPGLPSATVWRQRSQTSADAGDVPSAALDEARALRVAGRCVAPIACGEVFSPAVRERVAEMRPHLAVLAAHSAGGARHWAGQRCLARLGVRSVRAVHAATEARDFLCTAARDRPPDAAFEVSGMIVSCFDV
jgi:hypothetical protein